MGIENFLHSNFNKADSKINLLDQRYLPRWVVLCIDIFICILSFLIMVMIFNNMPIKFNTEWPVPLSGLFLISVNVLYFYLFGTYAGIVRHSTFRDIFRVATASFFTALTVFIINYIYFLFEGEKIFFTTAIVIYTFLSFIFLLFFRIAVKEAYQFLRNMTVGTLKKRVLIVGVDDYTISLGNALTAESNLPYKLIGFVTENSQSNKIKILNKPVFSLKMIESSEKFKQILIQKNIDGILMVSESLTLKEKNRIVEACISSNIKIFNVPLVQHWNSRDDINAQIKPLQIEDLLERTPIATDIELIKEDLFDKKILVTGGAGSIGSEIVRQLAKFTPKKIVIVDNAESALHEIELQILENYPTLDFSFVLADIRNLDRLEMLFKKYNFDRIYHAAAYKHVPLIEKNPHEAIYVNIMGTVNLAKLAVKYNVDKFVLISTDKAVNPTSVMGASKRAAEMFVQSLQLEKGTNTKFITTRFGNVLGSNGSVIPYFRKQIESGGPVTVTHRDIIRYFMTISEACELVLQAGTMGNGGEIYVFDMGKPIKILDMAERMIRLSGFIPYDEIDIKISGLRPGEKLYEELLNESSTSLATHHPKIMISKVPSGNFIEINNKIDNIIASSVNGKSKDLVKKLKELIPEYVSQNSEFQILDSEIKTIKNKIV